jgi:hypothetical protein
VSRYATVQPPPNELRIGVIPLSNDAASTLPVGYRGQLYAYADWPDGRRDDVSAFGSWSSTNSAAAVVSPSGFLSAIAAGVTDIGISYLGCLGDLAFNHRR